MRWMVKLSSCVLLPKRSFDIGLKGSEGDYLARRASALTMEWQRAGKNVPEMLGGMATFLQLGLVPERMLDLVVAW